MKASAIKRHRNLAKWAIWEAEIESMPWEYVIVEVKIFYRTKRTRDDDNAMGSLKSYYDGIVDSGLIADDNISNMKRNMPELLFDSIFPRVEIILTRASRGIQ